MGFNVQLEGEDGLVTERISDSKGLLYSVLPQEANGAFQYLPFIDPYGDTVFNRPQMKPFLREWDRLMMASRNLEVRRSLGDVKRLAVACESGVHLYLRFVGE
jgi:hypothetical protein